MEEHLVAAFTAVASASDKASRSEAEQFLVKTMLDSPCAMVGASFSVAVQHAHEPVGLAAATSLKRLSMDNWRTCSATAPNGEKALLCCTAAKLLSDEELPRPSRLQLSTALGIIASCEASASVISDNFLGIIEEPLANPQSTAWQRVAALNVLHQFLKSLAQRLSPHATPIFKRYAEPCYDVMTRTMNDTDGHLEELVLASKCLLRCSVSGVFDASVVARCAELTATLMASVSSASSEGRVTVLNRVGKIVTSACEKRASVLGELDVEVFCSSILPLLCNATAPQSGLPAKFVSRCLAALHTLLDLTMSDEFLTAAVGQFFSDPATVRLLLQNLVTAFLCDADVTDEDWDSDPERCVIAAELDEDGDDEVHCAQQVWLSMLSVGGEAVTGPAWELLGELMGSSAEGSAIGAMHAVGIAYDFLAEEHAASFREFLSSRLLPAMSGNAPASRRVVRRAVWLTGMWCFTVTEPSERKTVQQAFTGLLLSANDAVITLTALRAMENYVTDSWFTLHELPAELPQILARVGEVMPRLRDPDSVKLVANLLSSLMSKTNTDVISFDSVIALLAPILSNYVQQTVTQDDRSVGACVGELFRILAQAASQCGDSNAAFAALGEVAIFTIDPETTASTMADAEAWDTLYALVKGVKDNDAAAASWIRRVMEVCVANIEREFEKLPTALYTIATGVLALKTMGQATSNDAAAVCDVVVRLLAFLAEEQRLQALQCVVEAVIMLEPSASASVVFPAAMAAVQRLIGEGASAMCFNAVAAMVCRAGQCSPELWAACDVREGFLDAVVERHDEMTDEYQARIIVNGVVLAVASSSVSPDMQGYITTMHESQGLREEHDEPPELYLAMWGDDGMPSPHAVRLSAVAAADSWCTLLPLPS